MRTERENLLIQNARHIFTVDEDRRVLPGDILVEDGKIAAIGPNLEAEGVKRIDATDMEVIPGFVDAHDHLFQRLYEGIPHLKKRPLLEWVRTMSELVDGLDEEAAFSAASIGMAEFMLLGGVGIGNHSYAFPHGRTGIFDAEAEAAHSMGMNLVNVRGSLSYNERGESMYPDTITEDPDDILAHCAEVLSRYKDDELVTVALGPCGYYSGSSELFRQTAELARTWQARLHAHALESSLEDEQNRELFGKSALEFLESVGFLGPEVSLAHCIYASEEDIQRLARTRTGVAHAPGCSTAKKRVPRIAQMLEAGVNVGIGTDGAASNHNMLNEAWLAGRLQGMNPDAQGVSYFRATQILELATLGSARTLGIDGIAGSIEVGKPANFAMVDITRRIETSGFPDDEEGSLEAIFGGLTTVDYTIINGQVVVERGELMRTNGLGLTEFIRNHNEIAGRLRARAEEKLGRPLTVGWVRALKN
jgi:cytosine/adenosine deaminase-related metal-dependent hydrolase